MRLLWLYFMALLAGFFTGCGSTQPTITPTPPIVVNNTLVIDQLVDNFHMDNLTTLDDSLVYDYIGINPKHIENYYGFLSLAHDYPDCAIYIKAMDDKTDTVIKDLTKHLTFLQDAYFHTENWQYLKLHYGELFIYDQDIYLVIGGRQGNDISHEAAEINAFLSNAYAP